MLTIYDCALPIASLDLISHFCPILMKIIGHNLNCLRALILITSTKELSSYGLILYKFVVDTMMAENQFFELQCRFHAMEVGNKETVQNLTVEKEKLTADNFELWSSFYSMKVNYKEVVQNLTAEK